MGKTVISNDGRFEWDEEKNEINRKKHGFGFEEITDEITQIVEDYFKIMVNRNSFSYSRFVTHLNYLLNRLCSNESINSDNEELLSSIKECYPEVYKCSQIISSYLEDKFNKKLSEEEKLYMVLHINRVCAKEEI